MRPLSRLDGRLDKALERLLTLHLSKPTRRSVCPACQARRTVAQQAQSTYSTSTSLSEKLPFTEKLRRQIWGTDNPPGQADPYESKSKLEQRQEAAEEPKPAPEAKVTVMADDHEPATTWDGLDSVGGSSQREKELWDEQHPYNSFMAHTRITSAQEATAALHRAVVEVYTLQQAGRPLAELSCISPADDMTRTAQASPASDGRSVDLIYPDEETRQGILEAAAVITAEEESASPAAADPTDLETDSAAVFESTTEAIEETSPSEPIPDPTGRLQQLDEEIASWGASWHAIPLHDLSVKFAVVKRVMQLTGQRIADPTIARVHDVRALLDVLVTPPRPKKLAEALAKDERLTGLPNVTIYGRRVTPIDKERMVGRWKLIEDELRARGLPVTGRG